MQLLVHYVLQAIYLIYVTHVILQITISLPQELSSVTFVPSHSVIALPVPRTELAARLAMQVTIKHKTVAPAALTITSLLQIR